MENTMRVATDHYGSRVMKTLMEMTSQDVCADLFDSVAALTMKLAEDQYGNYIVQAALDAAPQTVRVSIKKQMEHRYIRLSKHKFSNNIVDKCLKQNDEQWRHIIMQELVSSKSVVSELIRGRYGNYVLQTALLVATNDQMFVLLRAIGPNLRAMRDKVRLRWEVVLKKALEWSIAHSPSKLVHEMLAGTGISIVSSITHVAFI
jgi:pumilio RNA-binding family